MSKSKPKRPSKFDEPIRLPIPVTPEQLARTIFTGKPKPKRDWDYLKSGKRPN